MSDKTYNGWSNYETWNVALWMDNDPSTYEHWRERAQDFVDEKGSKALAESDAYQLGDEIEASHEEAAPELQGCYADILSAALREVDWREIAEHLIADADEVEGDDDETDPIEETRDEGGGT